MNPDMTFVMNPGTISQNITVTVHPECVVGAQTRVCPGQAHKPGSLRSRENLTDRGGSGAKWEGSVPGWLAAPLAPPC